MSSNADRIQVRFGELLKEIDKAVNGGNRSAWIKEAVREKLDREKLDRELR